MACSRPALDTRKSGATGAIITPRSRSTASHGRRLSRTSAFAFAAQLAEAATFRRGRASWTTTRCCASARGWGTGIGLCAERLERASCGRSPRGRARLLRQRCLPPRSLRSPGHFPPQIFECRIAAGNSRPAHWGKRLRVWRRAFAGRPNEAIDLRHLKAPHRSTTKRDIDGGQFAPQDQIANVTRLDAEQRRDLVERQKSCNHRQEHPWGCEAARFAPRGALKSRLIRRRNPS